MKQEPLHWPVSPNLGLRGIDDFGDGAFGADRVTSTHSAGSAPVGTSYGHMGLDIAAKPGTILIAPCAGILAVSGYAYKGGAGDLRSIHLLAAPDSPWAGYRFVILYADASERAKMPTCKAGDMIGVVQDVAAFHMGKGKRKMVNHVHFAAYRKTDKGWLLTDPTPMFETAA